MPEVEHTALVAAPVAAVWEFCQDMANWAPLLTGYQAHEVVNDRESVWTLKGEVGGLTRTVQFRVEITEWNGPERVRFTLTGLNEPMTGGGVFHAAPAAAVPPGTVVVPPPSRWARWRERFVRWLFTRLFRRGATEPGALSAPAQSQITFGLALNAGGPAGPMINVLVAPLLQPVAADFATRVARAVEQRTARGPSS